MKTIILLAGHATRMRPLSDYLNKGMIPLEGKPLAEYVVSHLVRNGFTDLIFAVTMFPEQLEKHFGDGERFGAHIQYVHRPEPSGTAGEVYALRDLIPPEESFLVHYGDILHAMDLRAMHEQHEQTNPAATIGLVTNVTIHTGVAEMDAEGKLLSFVEKPILEKPCHAAVNIFGPAVWDYLAPGADFGYDVIPAMIRAGEPVMGFVDATSWWLDVGRISDLDAAARMVREQGLAAG